MSILTLFLIILFTFTEVSAEGLIGERPRRLQPQYKNVPFKKQIIPEPTTLSLLGLGALGFALARKRRRSK